MSMNADELDEQTVDELQDLLKDLSTPEKWAIVPAPIAVAPMMEEVLGYKGTRRYVAFYVSLRTFEFGFDDGEFHPSDIAVWKEFTSHPLVASTLDYPSKEGFWLMLDRSARRLYVGVPTKVRLFLDINFDEEVVPAQSEVHDIATVRRQIRAWLDAELEKPAAQYRLGCWHEKYDRFTDAMLAYEEAARLDSDLASKPDLNCRLANLYFRHKRLSEAIRTFDRALEIQPNNAPALWGLGLALIGEGRIDDAIATFKRHTELQPESAESHSGLGMALGISNRYSEAVRAYTIAVRIDPSDANIRSDLAAMYALSGDIPAAFREYRVALKLGLEKEKERELLKLL
jgi:tetratricopeptide (TPR) repeat protein